MPYTSLTSRYDSFHTVYDIRRCVCTLDQRGLTNVPNIRVGTRARSIRVSCSRLPSVCAHRTGTVVGQGCTSFDSVFTLVIIDYGFHRSVFRGHASRLALALWEVGCPRIRLPTRMRELGNSLLNIVLRCTDDLNVVLDLVLG